MNKYNFYLLKLIFPKLLLSKYSFVLIKCLLLNHPPLLALNGEG